PSINFNVRLPAQPATITDVFLKTRLIQIDRIELAKLQVGGPAQIQIQGKNLWRNSRVFLGPYEADKLQILPNMQGLLATFTNVDPSLATGSPTRLSIFTSEYGELGGLVTVPAATTSTSTSQTSFAPRAGPVVLGTGNKNVWKFTPP